MKIKTLHTFFFYFLGFWDGKKFSDWGWVWEVRYGWREVEKVKCFSVEIISIAFNKNLLFKLCNFWAQRHFVRSLKFKACNYCRSFCCFLKNFSSSQNMESILDYHKSINLFLLWYITSHQQSFPGWKKPPSS